MKQRTQADDLKNQIKKLELALWYCSDSTKQKELENKIMEAKSILYNIM
jgi:hypothetical protein|tara:strand:- start:194 stop:340 length:147 start_codon:yes stop_codon:yes gene_type:complete